MAACAVILLGACDQSTSGLKDETDSGTLEDPTSPAPLRPIDAATRERIEMLRKRQDHHLNTQPSLIPTPSPTAEK
jgi:hypothetical protein